jgi:hypothetical protein
LSSYTCNFLGYSDYIGEVGNLLLESDEVTELAAKVLNGHEQRKRRNDWFDEKCN